MDEYQVFISYRRKTGEKLALLLHDRLRAKGYRVFFDFEAMRSGKFNEQLYDVIDKCTDFLLVLSEGALDRCCNINDWVRLEIEHALSKRKNIIPVIDRDYKTPDSLPESLKDIHEYQAVTATTEYFDAVVGKIIKYLKSTPDASHEKYGDAANIKYCAICGAQLLKQAEICPKCGVRQAPPGLGLFGGADGSAAPLAQPAANVKYCAACGKALHQTAEICPNCGLRQAGSPDTPSVQAGGSSRSMGFFESWATCLKKTFVYKGRASQSEYAYFTLSIWALYFLFPVIAPKIPDVLAAMLLFGPVLPSLSVSVRRCHDFDASGMYLLLIFFMWMIFFVMFMEFSESKKISSETQMIILQISILICIVNIARRKGVNGENHYGS